jgi:hypothetical protein
MLEISQEAERMGFSSDDDIFSDFLYDIFLSIEKYGIEAVSVSCLRENEKVVLIR